MSTYARIKLLPPESAALQWITNIANHFRFESKQVTLFQCLPSFKKLTATLHNKAKCNLDEFDIAR